MQRASWRLRLELGLSLSPMGPWGSFPAGLALGVTSTHAPLRKKAYRFGSPAPSSGCSHSFVLLHIEGAYALIALWLGAKLAASWHRLPTEPYGDTQGDDEKREYNRQIRAGTLCALIAGIVSVLIGALTGLVVRNVCQCCVLS